MPDMPINPIKKFSRVISSCPPDKSITHRAVMLSSLADGVSTVRGILLGEDCRATIDCMRRLGVIVEIDGDTARITGGKRLRSADLYAANSGTTMRLLCGVLASNEGRWSISGDQSLSCRPMKRVIDPLTEMGGKIGSRDGRAPLEIDGGKLHGIRYDMPIASAQVKSAVLLAGLNADGMTTVVERERTRDHTEIMLSHMGADITVRGNEITICGGRKLSPIDMSVAGDISSAAYPLICGLMTGGVVTVRSVGINPTRAGLLEIFDQIGVEYGCDGVREECGEKVCDITVRSLGDGKGFRIGGELLPRLIDEIPVLAVLACALGGDSVIEDAGELRVKESDRIAAVARLINAFGGNAEERGDGVIIHPVGRLAGGAFDPLYDHRMAMAAAVALAASERGGRVLGGECVAVSYPDFWDMLVGG